MQQAKLPVETINKVLNFLATLPYSQVADLIAEVQTSAVVQPVEEETEQTES